MTPKTALSLILALSCALASGCGKARNAPVPPPGPAPGPGPVAAGEAPVAPAGPLWDALARLPVALRGTVGVADYRLSRAGHAEWTEGRHDRNAEEFELGIAAKFGIKPEEVLTFAWAELTFSLDSGLDTFLMARLSTPGDRLRAALRDAGFELSKGPDEIWSPTREKDKFVPQRILLKDDWLVRTLGGDDAIARIARVWSGQDPTARLVAHTAALVAALPGSLPAVVRFGTADRPLPDSPLRVIAMSNAPDPSTGEDVVAVAFNDEAGAEKMMASKEWKAQMEVLKEPPKAEKRGRYLVVRMRPDADPALVERQRDHVKSVLASLKTAINRRELDRGAFPERLDELWTGEGPLVTNPGFDPWGHPYLYRRPAPAGNDPYDLRSVGPDGKADTADDITN